MTLPPTTYLPTYLPTYKEQATESFLRS